LGGWAHYTQRISFQLVVSQRKIYCCNTFSFSLLRYIMARKRIARIGDKGTALPPRLRYSREPSVLGQVGADATAAVWECRWSREAQAYLQSLDIPAMMLRQGIRHGRRDMHLSGFGVDTPADIDVHIARILKVFPRTRGYLSFARDMRRNLREALTGANVGAASVSLLARADGAWGVLHEDSQPTSGTAPPGCWSHCRPDPMYAALFLMRRRIGYHRWRMTGNFSATPKIYRWSASWQK